MTGQESPLGSASPRILVGVDGSQDGLRALTYATREAQATGGHLWIVHAVDEAMMVTGLWDLLSTREVLLRAGEAILTKAVAVVGELGLPSARVTAEVVFGRPSEVLADLSRKAELLVLGRRSLIGLERMFVGSTSVAAAVHAECPVIVISAASTPHQTGGLRTVAVAVSTWPVHESALEWGFREAAVHKARLRVVHVVPETLGVEGPGFVSAATAGIEEQVAPIRQKHPGIPLEIEVLLGDPVDSLVTMSKTVHLLIVGVHRDHAGLGGAVRGLMAHSHCPVGLVK